MKNNQFPIGEIRAFTVNLQIHINNMANSSVTLLYLDNFVYNNNCINISIYEEKHQKNFVCALLHLCEDLTGEGETKLTQCVDC